MVYIQCIFWKPWPASQTHNISIWGYLFIYFCLFVLFYINNLHHFRISKSCITVEHIQGINYDQIQIISHDSKVTVTHKTMFYHHSEVWELFSFRVGCLVKVFRSAWRFYCNWWQWTALHLTHFPVMSHHLLVLPSCAKCSPSPF